MTLVVSRIVNDVSYVRRINDEIHFAWQVQYLVSWKVTLLALRIVNDVSCVRRIDHEIHFAWQAQYFVKVEAAFCCFAHGK